MRRYQRSALRVSALILALAVISPAALAGESPLNWDLTEIYASEEAWAEAKGGIAGKIKLVDPYKGKLGESSANLKAVLDASYAIQMQASRLYGYASMRGDEDLRESGPQGMQAELQSMFADMTAATAWIDPEILTIPAETLKQFQADDPGLAMYARYLERLEKQRPHVLDAKSEQLLGMGSRIVGVGANIGGLLRNAEIPWPTITLSDGTELRLDPSGYTVGRIQQNREDRIKSYQEFFGTFEAFKGTLAATVAATVNEHVFNTQVRSYDSSLHASVSGNEVDPAVYRMLIKEINNNLPTLHRYIKLRARIMGIDDLRYHDMYPSLVSKVDADYSWENSKKLVLDALKPLGGEYVRRFGHALESGWVDVYPRKGKRSGAYVTGAAYEVHPYMLLNHTDDYNGTSTLAHEGGHLMHSSFSQEANPYPTSGYAIFVAEVASTVNEVLLQKDLVAKADGDEARLALLGNFLESLRNTVFRQTMFAEFELAIHEMVERGEALTGDNLNELYAEMIRRYHGEAEGVMKIDDLYTVEWAFIPHFHYNFYVYQYATSYVAAIALAEGIMEDRPGARDNYLTFLKSGGTRPPVDLLKSAGVDMTSPEPIHAAMRLMNEVMDQIDQIIEKR
ncbi:MAG: oligoendopeptidase F [Acidobacteria bacterium]|uniref:Oligopeptidase F n=1 Tax=Candidatus Polarisedimenticola svalbardensis TaxID=2886004 RepID=A0A8J7CME3_9BACT|nr:oligoendopeptidase F [Candidatus Polarisedimenticola svalbardensis]